MIWVATKKIIHECWVKKAKKCWHFNKAEKTDWKTKKKLQDGVQKVLREYIQIRGVTTKMMKVTQPALERLSNRWKHTKPENPRNCKGGRKAKIANADI